ncbi:hypothetical protein [Pedobacter rhizosphaerae]|uniref:hypothetical protein n=1 Tax=Pedobacter rhizosphaerae TaxID=390241 RepID=UPI0011134257|nr:hypothetical protein [Pedobacter rhizosphaerae]
MRNSRISTSLSLSREKGSTDLFYSAEHSRFNGVTDLGRKGSYTATNNNSSNIQSRTNAYINLSFGRHMINPSVAITLYATSSDSQSIIAT